MRRRQNARAASAALAALLSACGYSSGSDPRDTTPPQPPVVALVTVAQRAPGTADGVSGAAGAVERGVEVVARAGTADGAELGRIAAAADGSFGEIPVGDNAHDTIALLAVDGAGNVSTTATVVTNDIVAPETALDPASTSTTAVALELTFSSSEGGAFVCDLDGAGEAPCVSPLFVTSLAPGDHALSVRAVDAAGNRDPSAAVHAWTVEPSWAMVAFGGVGNACGLVNDGRVYCWGSAELDGIGAQGIGAHGDPQLAGTGFRSLTNGDDHACGLHADGSLWCWGRNDAGQLGFAGAAAIAPVQSGSETDWASVASGWGFTCGLKASGALLCWGNRGEGSLGDGSFVGTQPDPTPVSTATITSGARWTTVVSGVLHACALRDDGSLYCWGYNGGNQLGNHATAGQNSALPVRVDGTWRFVSAGQMSNWGIQADGSLWFWGTGLDGAGASQTPLRIGAETDWVGVAAGSGFMCAWKGSGATTCRGDDPQGQIGNGRAVNGAVTATLPFPTRLVAAGRSACAVTSSGDLRCWGPNQYGEVGTGAIGDKTSPVHVAPGLLFDALALEYQRTCALSGGTRWCTGWDRSSQLGDGGTDTLATLEQVDAYGDWAAITLAQRAGLGLRSGGALWGWGDSSQQALLGASTSYDPIAIGTTGFWTGVSAAANHVLAIRPDGTLDAWGMNDRGQLGDGSQTTRFAASPVHGGATWTMARGHESHSCGIRTDGTLWCWGGNDNGQLGNGSAVGVSTLEPTEVGSTSWTRVATGYTHTCGIRSSELWCWGYPYANSPARVASSLHFDEVAVGALHDCALSSGKLYCWGRGSEAELGLGDRADRAAPTQVGTWSDWTALSVGSYHGCGLRNGGELWCWGRGMYGAIGDGTGFYATPQPVPLPSAP